MPLTVLPATPLDLAYPSPIHEVFFAGFTDPPNPALPLLHPGKDIFSPEFRKLHDKHAAAYAASPKARWQYNIKCVDTDPNVPVRTDEDGGAGTEENAVATVEAIDHQAIALATAPAAPGGGAVVGMATWEMFHRERAPDEWAPPAGVEWLPEGSEDRLRADAFFSAIWKKRAEIWQGRKYLYLHLLSVHPAHRRRGIASLLMQWGIDIAEQLHLPVYLEATPMGVPLYEKVGFRLLEEEFILRNVGFLSEKGFVEPASDNVTIPLMVKMPSAAKGMSFEEWRDMGFPAFS